MEREVKVHSVERGEWKHVMRMMTCQGAVAVPRECVDKCV